MNDRTTEPIREAQPDAVLVVAELVKKEGGSHPFHGVSILFKCLWMKLEVQHYLDRRICCLASDQGTVLTVPASSSFNRRAISASHAASASGSAPRSCRLSRSRLASAPRASAGSLSASSISLAISRCSPPTGLSTDLPHERLPPLDQPVFAAFAREPRSSSRGKFVRNCKSLIFNIL